jgi:3-oxoacyl-[acyl-carrier protein] reductase
MLIQDLKASAERIPVGRFGTSTEVAGIVLSLVQNAYVTGQTISVNGGVYMT